MRDEASRLDSALSGADMAPGTDTLVDTARELQAAFDVPLPLAGRERAFFVEGAAAAGQPRRSWWLLVAPIAALGGVFVLFLALAGRALPGDTLYPVREVMGSVGLVGTGLDDIKDIVEDAGRHVTKARSLAAQAPGRARTEAVYALGRLGVARELLAHLDGDASDALLAKIDGVERQATAALLLAADEVGDRDRPEADGSGPGPSGEDDAGEDNSGPGDGEGEGDGDDSSGPGSGSEDGSEGDSSGSGSGDDDSGTDGSGSGDDSGDDSSGSGSDSGDSSGSGSGSDDSFEEDSSGSDSDSSGSGSGDELDDPVVEIDSSGSGGGED